jgi:hypothetical protein
MTYDNEFYDLITDRAIQSAREVLSLYEEIINFPLSVIDWGCGRGAWLSVAKEMWSSKVLGIDGEWVTDSLLSQDEFASHDLANEIIGINESKFDLAISLEVAEHLPYHSADLFVENIARSSDRILFSAAIPGQKGVGHINEQWPSFWIQKFEQHGFRATNYFRARIWDTYSVEPWYRQNLLYLTKHHDEIPSFEFPFNIVLPDVWNAHAR